MTATIFVDTNVLLYARDSSEPEKQPIAARWLEALWEQHRGRLSYQVLSEYYVSVTRKLRPGLDREIAQADIRDLMSWRPVRIDSQLLEDAWWLEGRFGLSYWDSQIVAAARAGGCRYLLTEDLQHGQDLDGLLVMDPFEVPPEAFDHQAVGHQ
jgi:predicted nucleic acid-binding protein